MIAADRFPHIMPRLKAVGVLVTAQDFVERVDQNGVYVYDTWGGDSAPRSGIDSAVLALTPSSRDINPRYF